VIAQIDESNAQIVGIDLRRPLVDAQVGRTDRIFEPYSIAVQLIATASDQKP
jgi:hypothetical protein